MPEKSNAISSAQARRHDVAVSVITFGSILGILALWLQLQTSTIFWIYSILITGFLFFTYGLTRGYRPVEDNGFRPSITVVIPAKNEEGVIESVIETVFRSEYPAPKMEVIVVDDGSTDDTWEKILHVRKKLSPSHQLVLVKHEQNYGKRVALASAISKASGEIVVCIDSDSFVDRDAVKLLVQPFEDHAVVAACGHGEAANGAEGLLPKLQHYWYSEMFRLVKGMESRLGIVSCCSGMLAAYRKDSIMLVVNKWSSERTRRIVGNAEYAAFDAGRSDHSLTDKLFRSPGEDRILTAYALSGKGARTVYQSNAIVHTIVPASFRQFLKQQLRWNRAWIHGSLLASRFMWRKSLAASFSFYLYQLLVILTPAVIILWIIVDPLKGQWVGTIGFVAGTVYVGFLHGLNTWSLRKTSLVSIPYRMAFVFVSFFLTLTVLLYAWATPWKMGWITKTSTTDYVGGHGERPLQEMVPG